MNYSKVKRNAPMNNELYLIILIPNIDIEAILLTVVKIAFDTNASS